MLGGHDTIAILQQAGFPNDKLKTIESDLLQCKTWVLDGKYPTEKKGGEIQETLEADHFGMSLQTLNIIKVEAAEFLQVVTDTGTNKWIRAFPK